MHSLRPLALTLALASLGTLAACVHKKDKVNQAPSASASAAAAPDPVAAFLADRSQRLTPQIEETLLLALRNCKVDDNGIQPRCPDYRKFNQARVRKWQSRDPAAEGAALGTKHLADKSPAVRLMSARMMGAKAGTSEPTRQALLAAAQKEKVPGVLVSMLRALGSHQQGNAAIGKLLMQSADSPSPRVQMEALGWLLTPAGAAIDGGFKKVTDKLDKDSSVQLRSYLCSRLYGSENPAAVDEFKKFLLAKDTPPQLAQGCFRGLITAWTGYPLPPKPLKQAYELTLQVLQQTPRTQQVPPYAAISSLRAARTDYDKARHPAGVAWLDQVKPWYKKDQLLKALESLAGDLDAHWLARSSALDVMHALGAPKAAFKRVLSHYAKATGQDAAVKRRIEAIVNGTIVPKRPAKGRPGMVPPALMRGPRGAMMPPTAMHGAAGTKAPPKPPKPAPKP